MAGLRQRIAARGGWDEASELAASPNQAASGPLAVPPDGRAWRLARLVRTIEAEIIPRLVLARRAAAPQPARPPAGLLIPQSEDIEELARLVLERDEAPAVAFIEALHARGAAAETLYLDLLAPAARHLGVLWEADVCSFMQVTLGLWRLQQVLCELSPAFQLEDDFRALDRRALLIPLPGEQHTFGLAMVSEFFRRAGWDVWSGPLASSGDLAKVVGREWFAVVGLSVSSTAMLDRLAAAIRVIRRTSRNQAIGVMVGGPIFVEHPEIVALVGADATAADGRQAALQAQLLLELLARAR
jgi:methanogenic corrinoid protein MtbC1